MHGKQYEREVSHDVEYAHAKPEGGLAKIKQ
jgi:hypothetical protein